MNIGTMLEAAATGDPARVALIIEGRSLGYGELAATVCQCAAGLADSGVVAGQRVAVVDGGSVLSIATVLGAARIGAAAALMNPALTPPELHGLLASAGCAGVAVAGEPYVDRLRAAGAPTVVTGADLLEGAGSLSVARRRCRPRCLGPVHQRDNRTPEGRRHQRAAADEADHGDGGTVPGRRQTLGGDDVRSVFPCRGRTGHARQFVFGQYVGGTAAI